MIQLLARRLALTAVLLAPAAPALAQDTPTVMPNAYVITDILNSQRVDAAIGGAAQPVSSPSHLEANRPATAYRASPEVSARVQGLFTEWMAVLAGTEGGRRVAVALADRDPVRSWAKIVGTDGLRPGDMADALAGYWILNWVMANGADSGRAEAQAVRLQARQMIATSPSLARLDEAERQEFSEMLMLNFLIQHAAYTDAVARDDRDAVRRLGEAAVDRFKTKLGIDLRALTLSDAGFTGG